MSTSNFRAGQIVPLRYKSRELKAIVIDPNGLGVGKPSIGLGFRSMDRHIGVPQATLSRRVMQIEGERWLELPSSKRFRVMQSQPMTAIRICSWRLQTG